MNHLQAASRYIELREQMCGTGSLIEHPGLPRFLGRFHAECQAEGLDNAEILEAIRTGARTFRMLHNLRTELSPPPYNPATPRLSDLKED